MLSKTSRATASSFAAVGRRRRFGTGKLTAVLGSTESEMFLDRAMKKEVG